MTTALDGEQIARLELAGRLKSSLIHELSTPLQAILSNAEAAQRALGGAQAPDLAALRELVTDVRSSGKRAADAVARLRAFMSGAALQYEPLDINRLIEAAATFLHSDFIKRNINVTAHLDPRLPAWCGDRVRIELVVLNLLVDAADAASAFAPRDGQITIRTWVSGSNLRIGIWTAVQDRAAGVAEADFCALVANENEHRWGSISGSAIVRSHGGTALVDDRGVGTSFHVALPIRESGRAIGASSTPSVSVPQAEQGRSPAPAVEVAPESESRSR